MSQKPEIQQRLQAELGLEDGDFAYYATDLYVVAKPGVLEWIKTNYPNVRPEGFVSQEGSNWNGAGKHCYDLPFRGNWPDKR